MSRKRSEASKNRAKLRQQRLRENDEVNAKRRLKRLYLKALADEDKPTQVCTKHICFYLINASGEILGRIAIVENTYWFNPKVHPSLEGNLSCHYVVKDNWIEIKRGINYLNELQEEHGYSIKPYNI